MNAEKPLPDETRLTIPEQVLARKVAGETVLLHLDNERYYGLPGVGARVWELVEAGTTFGAVVTTLFAEYDVQLETLVADLQALVLHLHDNGLLLIDAA